MDSLDLWSVPVPVRPSTFVPMVAEHATYNVEVDLAQIEPFGFARDTGGDSVLFADLQSNADGHVNRRLGSGRSGYFAGAYLKGIGRTQLAANWMGHDRYHASGHLLPSGAARERLISVFLEAAGGAETITACRGVLARALPEPGAPWIATLRGTQSLCRADLALQAITVKPGSFARLSNFLWALDNFGLEPTWLSDYFLAVRKRLDGNAGRGITKADVTPADLARAFKAAFERGLASFATYRRLGIDWGSYHNNFTADGRFLDLEVPLVVGHPLIGWASRRGGDLRRGKWLGVDAGRYVRQMRDFLVAYRARLGALPEHLFSDPAVEFLRELVHELDAVFPAHHLVFDERALADHLVDALAAEWNMTAHARRDAAIIVADSLQRRGQLPDEAWQRLALVELPQRFKPAEAGPDVVLHVPASLIDAVEPTLPRGAAFDDVLRACDDADSLARWFDALARGEGILGGRFESICVDRRACARR